MSEQSFEMIAKTFQGLEEVLAQELTALGANEIEIGRRMASLAVKCLMGFSIRMAESSGWPDHHRGNGHQCQRCGGGPDRGKNKVSADDGMK